VGTSLPLLPIPQRLQADPEHSRKLPLSRVKLVSELHDMDLRELDVSATAIWSVFRLQGTLDVTEWVLEWR